MAQRQVPQAIAVRRCPNCGTRVARDAESCFMCGHDLRIQPKKRQRISWVDALLVLAVLAVLSFWWQLGGQPQEDESTSSDPGLLPADIPQLGATETPTPTAVPTPTVTPEPVEVVFRSHEVQQGQTLLAIANLYGVTVDQIKAANNREDDFLQIGDRLIIPVGDVDPTQVVIAPTAPVTKSTFKYTVQSGDTIVSIATTFGSTIQDIQGANNLTDNAIIRPGDVLTVPVPDIPEQVLESLAESIPESEIIVQSENLELNSANKIYIEPRLIGPPDDEVISRDEVVLLRWISVDVLAPNEWYVLSIYPIGGAAQELPTVWTKATSYRLGIEALPNEGEFASYSWQVSVVRVHPIPNGAYELKPTSPPSLLRRFTWQ